LLGDWVVSVVSSAQEQGPHDQRQDVGYERDSSSLVHLSITWAA
jgi:hypothetical protein